MAEAAASNDLAAGIAGQRVLITAGAGGIGLAIARRLAAHGARLFVCDVSDEALAAFGRDFPDAGWIKADVSDEGDVDRMFDAAAARLGGLDALINNAGIAGPTGGVDAIVSGRLAPHHRCLPDRPVPLRPSRPCRC